MNLKKMLPWWFRIGAKIILARLPVGYLVWKKLGLFVHGDMNDPNRALRTYLLHAHTAGVLPILDGREYSVLELGPGDSVFTALIGRALGASRVWLVDAGRFATTDPANYENMAAHLEKTGYPLEMPSNSFGLEDVLKECNATYLTEGGVSLGMIPENSVDYCFSNAVLEHVPQKEFADLASELRRILKPDGVCVHRVDLKDHLGGGLNNLRFSEEIWEGHLFSCSGFYTNRIRFSDMLNMFERAGFECEITEKIQWSSLPIKRSSLASPFSNMSEDDLLVSGFDVILRPKKID